MHIDRFHAGTFHSYTSTGSKTGTFPFYTSTGSKLEPFHFLHLDPYQTGTSTFTHPPVPNWDRHFYTSTSSQLGPPLLYINQFHTGTSTNNTSTCTKQYTFPLYPSASPRLGPFHYTRRTVHLTLSREYIYNFNLALLKSMIF